LLLRNVVRETFFGVVLSSLCCWLFCQYSWISDWCNNYQDHWSGWTIEWCNKHSWLCKYQ